MRRGGPIAALLTAWVALAPPAPAAEIIGQNGPAAGCGQNLAYKQGTLSGGTPYSPSAPGVITSWTSAATATPGKTVKLLVLRPNPGPVTWLTTAKDEARTLTVLSSLNTFTDIHFPIQPGDELGVYIPPGQPGGASTCAFSMPTDILSSAPGGEPAVGANHSFPVGTANFRLNASAVVEPDCDGDLLGDETQDPDLVPCDLTAPFATLTKVPPEKSRKKTAVFEFSGSDARAITGFQCSLDGGPFATCTSPHTVKVKRGKHTFSVRAVDANGNVSVAATDTWKVKKKKKKRK